MHRSFESFCKRLSGPLCCYFELFFTHAAAILLESIESWVIEEKLEVKTFKTKEMSDKREICMQEYNKKVVLCESEVRYASKVGGQC